MFILDEKSVKLSSYKDPCYLLDTISHDFGKLLDEGPNYDVEFTCGNQTFKAHKNILCCRSSVFASMLQSDMVEGKTGRINIKDIDDIIFRQFLRCLYTGILPELTVDSAFQFYEVFDKYGVDSMKKQCADFLTDNLSPENVCDVLVLSDRHGDADFKHNVIQYVIKENIPYIREKWTDFCQKNLALAVEVYKLFCEKFRPQ